MLQYFQPIRYIHCVLTEHSGLAKRLRKANLPMSEFPLKHGRVFLDGNVVGPVTGFVKRIAIKLLLELVK